MVQVRASVQIHHVFLRLQVRRGAALLRVARHPHEAATLLSLQTTLSVVTTRVSLLTDQVRVSVRVPHVYLRHQVPQTLPSLPTTQSVEITRVSSLTAQELASVQIHHAYRRHLAPEAVALHHLLIIRSVEIIPV